MLFTNENDSLRRSEGKKDSDDVIEKAGVVFKDLDTAKVVNFVVDVDGMFFFADAVADCESKRASEEG